MSFRITYPLLAILFIGLHIPAMAFEEDSHSHQLEIDLDSGALRSLLKNQRRKTDSKKKVKSKTISEKSENLADKNPSQDQVATDSPILEKALTWGDRINKWLEFENKKRAEGNKLRLSNPQLRRGIPPESPSKFSLKTIDEKLKQILSTSSEEFVKILTSVKNDFPEKLPWDDETFITWARAVDSAYSSAARFKLLSPNLKYYKERKYKDIRGYLYLKKNNVTLRELRRFDSLPSEKQKELKEALIGICVNNKAIQDICEMEWDRPKGKKDRAADFYLTYYTKSEEIYQSFFMIPGSAKRSDVLWSSLNPELMKLSVDSPTRPEIQDFLQSNIEQEYVWGAWRLELDFGNYPDSPRVVFKPGVTPHVNKLGGNDIIMDANQSLEEYSVQWVIRHEFGHVLGLPDCYIEFYDEKEESFINYQIDITDLMCSRAGDFNQRIMDELRKNYFQ